MTQSSHHPDCACAADTKDAVMKASLCRMVHETDRKGVSRLADEFFIEHQAEVRRVLHRVTRNAHLATGMRDDLLSYVGEALMFLVTTQWQKAPHQFNDMTNFLHIWDMRTREILRNERLHGLAANAPRYAGGAGYRREMDLVARSRELFTTEHRREPSDRELCLYHNERMVKTRKDPRKQGVLLVPSELYSGEPVSLDDEASPVRDIAVIDQYDEGGGERQRRIAEIVEECDQIDHLEDLRLEANPRYRRRERVRIGDVARTFFRNHHIHQYPTTSDVRELLGIESKSATREVHNHLKTVMALSQAKFADLRQDLVQDDETGAPEPGPVR